MKSISDSTLRVVTHTSNSVAPYASNPVLKQITSIKNHSQQSIPNNIDSKISVLPDGSKTKEAPSLHMTKAPVDEVDASLFGRHTEKRIPGKPFQLAFDYSDKFNIRKKEPITYFDSVTVIGDSLSDSEGRMYKKSGGLLTNANQYYNGRFTNGFTWPEFLTMPNAMQSHKSNDGKVTLTNKSEGGSPCAPYFKSTLHPKFAILSNIEKQIRHLKFDDKNLGIIFLGANDYMTYAKENVDAVIASQEKTIKKMIRNGARNILVMGLPDLSQTPAIKNSSPNKQRKIQNLSIEHNNKLQTLVNLFKLNKNINIHYFNVNNVMKNITNVVDDINKNLPGAYNIEKAFADGYIRRDNASPLEIDPHYIFIDDVHPTQEVHSIIAMELHNFILKKYNPLNNKE